MSDINELLRETVEAVVAGMGLTASVTVAEGDEDNLVVSVDGEGLEPMIGRDGQVIDALQYLLHQAALRARDDDGSQRTRVVLDVGGYRDRRRRQLEKLALHAADEAVKYGEEIELDPMTPHDRRIVHMALAARTDIATRSEGLEPNRRIVVEPAGEGSDGD